MTDRCAKDDADMPGMCCCTCANRWPVHNHCTTVLTIGKSECVCGIQKSWACVHPEVGRVYDNWGEHGMCECWTQKPKPTEIGR